MAASAPLLPKHPPSMPTGAEIWLAGRCGSMHVPDPCCLECASAAAADPFHGVCSVCAQPHALSAAVRSGRYHACGPCSIHTVKYVEPHCVYRRALTSNAGRRIARSTLTSGSSCILDARHNANVPLGSASTALHSWKGAVPASSHTNRCAPAAARGGAGGASGGGRRGPLTPAAEAGSQEEVS